MRVRTSLASAAMLAIALCALRPAPADAGCGCSKPPPPRAAVRPFVGYENQTITLFNDALAPGRGYWVQFISTVDGSSDWSRGKVSNRRDFADGTVRPQMRVAVGDVSLGPCSIAVWADSNGPLFTLGDDQFTVIAPPVSLHDYAEQVTQNSYQAAVGKDGTIYIAVDVSQVNGGTTFVGTANGYPLMFGNKTISMYNEQGFLMQVLDPTSPGLFQIIRGGNGVSDTLAYWRHEFATYKDKHRVFDNWRNDDDADWHADGTPHIDHNRIVVAVSGKLPNGNRPVPGATPAFQLVINSTPAPVSPLQ